MKSSQISHHLLASLVLTLTPAILSCAQAGENNTSVTKDGTTSDATNTVTRYEQPPIGDYWTPEKMRKAKPFPLPSRHGDPLVPQQMTPNPSYTGRAGSSPPPGLGGPVHR
jgi:hypothetical protein